MNIDPKTGIHYGVIRKNDLFNCAEEFYERATDLTYELEENNLKNVIETGLGGMLNEEHVKEIVDIAVKLLREEYEGDCAVLLYEQDGFKLYASNDDTDLMVLKSPYYTYAKKCSPCAPNAGDLSAAVKSKDEIKSDMVKTYCLPADWFDEEEGCPYEYWEVEEE